MDNNFNPYNSNPYTPNKPEPDSDFIFDGDSFNFPAPETLPNSSVAPEGYTVPARFTRRSSTESHSLPSDPTSTYSEPTQPLYQPNYPMPTGNSGNFGAFSQPQSNTYYPVPSDYNLSLEQPQTNEPYTPADTVNTSEQAAPVDEPEEFFVPTMPDGYSDEAPRNRYRTRNRHPLKFPVKAAITAAVIGVLFTILSFAVYNILISARVNHVREGAVSTVRLAASEKSLLSREVNTEETDASSFSQPDVIMENQKNIDLLLIIGSDNPISTGYPCTTNAMVLAAIDHKRECIKFVYLSTDLYVRIPGYYSNTLSEAFYYDTANGNDDLPLTMECITQNFGVTPDGFIVVDYLAFETVVERLGGVSLTLSDEEAAYMSSHSIFGIFKRFTAGGSYSMSSSETLNYIRIKDVGDGYLDRIDRQHLVFEYLLDSASSLSQLELAGIAYDVLPMCSTSLSKSSAKSIIKNASNILDYDFYWMQAPVRGSWRYGIAQIGAGSKKVIVTSYKFTAGAIQDFIYEDDMQYAAYNTVSGVVLPEVAPEPTEEATE